MQVPVAVLGHNSFLLQSHGLHFVLARTAEGNHVLQALTRCPQHSQASRSGSSRQPAVLHCRKLSLKGEAPDAGFVMRPLRAPEFTPRAAVSSNVRTTSTAAVLSNIWSHASAASSATAGAWSCVHRAALACKIHAKMRMHHWQY